MTEPMPPFELRPHHAAVSVPDLARSVAWYCDMLGFSPDRTIDIPVGRIAMLKKGDFRVELFEVPGAAPLPDSRRQPDDDISTHGNKHVALAVGDVAALVEELRSRGVEIVWEVMEMAGMKAAFIRDDSGNLVELMEDAGVVPGAHSAFCIADRRSIRAYYPEPVPDDLLRGVLEEARWAPSAGNTQTTWVYIVSGEPLERIRAGLRGRAESEAPPAPDLEMQPVWPEPFRSRFAALTKTRVDFVAAEAARTGAASSAPPVPPMVAMAGLFGAPVALIFAVDRQISAAYGCFDAGLFVQSVALAAHARGLGSCIMTSTVRHADLLHEVLPDAADKNLIALMTLGYPDPQAAINHFPRERVAFEDYVAFVRS